MIILYDKFASIKDTFEELKDQSVMIEANSIRNAKLIPELARECGSNEFLFVSVESHNRPNPKGRIDFDCNRAWLFAAQIIIHGDRIAKSRLRVEKDAKLDAQLLKDTSAYIRRMNLTGETPAIYNGEQIQLHTLGTWFYFRESETGVRLKPLTEATVQVLHRNVVDSLYFLRESGMNAELDGSISSSEYSTIVATKSAS